MVEVMCGGDGATYARSTEIGRYGGRLTRLCDRVKTDMESVRKMNVGLHLRYGGLPHTSGDGDDKTSLTD